MTLEDVNYIRRALIDRCVGYSTVLKAASDACDGSIIVVRGEIPISIAKRQFPNATIIPANADLSRSMMGRGGNVLLLEKEVIVEVIDTLLDRIEQLEANNLKLRYNNSYLEEKNSINRG